jgi:hypothetical protein
VTLQEQLRRANPTIDSLTYRRLIRKIDESQYQKELAEERQRISPPPDKEPASKK